MEVQVETPGGLLRQIRVRIPAERVSTALDDRLKKLATRARIPGFRPGKAPFKVVQQQYGESARLDVVQDLVRGSYPEAVDKAGVRPASAPSFEVMAEKPGEPLEYLARFEVYPEIKLQSLKDLKIEKPRVEVEESDVAKVIESLRRGRRTLDVVARPARQGDVCKLSFEGFLDGQAFSGGRGEDVELEIGQKQFLPDLENGVAGHSAGESFEVNVAFPADYRNEELRGKTAQFKVELKEVREPRLPEIDAEFLKAHKVDESAGAAGLQAKIRSALEAERDKAIRNRLKIQALDQLMAANPIEVPQAMVAQETPRLREEAVARFNAGQLKPEQKLKMLPDEMLEPSARRRVALGLLISEVIKDRKIVLDQPRLEKVLDEMAADYQQPDQIKQYYRSRPELMQGLRAVVLEDQVVEALISAVTPSEKTMSLDELLNPKPEAKS